MSPNFPVFTWAIRMTFEVDLKWYTRTQRHCHPTHMIIAYSMLNEQYETYQTIFQTILVVAKLKKPQRLTKRMRGRWMGLSKYCMPPKDYHIHVWPRKWWFCVKKTTNQYAKLRLWFSFWRNVMLLAISLIEKSYRIEMAALEPDTSKTIRVKWMDIT